MPRVYTKRQINAVLKELAIGTIDGMVYTSDAARILTWRAKAELAIEHEYTSTAVRKHSKHLQVQHPYKGDGQVNTRLNLIPVEHVFALRIAPERTNKGPRKQAMASN